MDREVSKSTPVSSGVAMLSNGLELRTSGQYMDSVLATMAGLTPKDGDVIVVTVDSKKNLFAAKGKGRQVRKTMKRQATIVEEQMKLLHEQQLQLGLISMGDAGSAKQNIVPIRKGSGSINKRPRSAKKGIPAAKKVSPSVEEDPGSATMDAKPRLAKRDRLAKKARLAYEAAIAAQAEYAAAMNGSDDDASPMGSTASKDSSRMGSASDDAGSASDDAGSDLTSPITPRFGN